MRDERSILSGCFVMVDCNYLPASDKCLCVCHSDTGCSFCFVPGGSPNRYDSKDRWWRAVNCGGIDLIIFCRCFVTVWTVSFLFFASFLESITFEYRRDFNFFKYQAV